MLNAHAYLTAILSKLLVLSFKTYFGKTFSLFIKTYKTLVSIVL